ncbi:MAG: decaprenyl-phosphate phosphoribosyltransferase [Candidatus Latescibacterota bacterium]|nr:decaprenyl-phosphate phosphoribosyltransferase [Candidatus Latescibacterota bacterium]
MILLLFRAMRPNQWIKNGFVLAALVFSRHLFDPAYVWRSAIAAVIFCVLSGAIYLINDIFDRENDSRHPIKRNRPIASRRLNVKTAGVVAALLIAVSLVAAFRIDTRFGIVCVVYWAQNLAYSSYLKHIVILDVMIVSAGFLLRAVGGAFVIDVTISSWFILCTMLLSLFIGFVKRRHEIKLLESEAGDHRKILDDYNSAFLDHAIGIVTAGALVTYALYTMSPEVATKLGTKNLNFTVPFVIYGLLRYLYLAYEKDGGDDPASTVLRDAPILINGCLWLLTLVSVLYFGSADGVIINE